MVEWDDFAAFGDIAELERVCELLEDDAAAVLLGADLSSFTAGNSYLRQQLQKQDRASLDLLEAEKPGLYVCTWIAHLFDEIWRQLDSLADQPGRVAEIMPTLMLNLHKVLIAAHDIYDPAHRARLTAAELADAMQKGAAQVVARQSRLAHLAATKSHSGRNQLREEAQKMFMAGGPWDSIAAAVQKIAPELVKRRDVSRPLAKGNAARTVREWLSKYIAEVPAALEKLTDAAQKRLKKPAASTAASNRIR